MRASQRLVHEVNERAMRTAQPKPLSEVLRRPANATAQVVTEWTAEGRRPAGQPGEVGRNHGAGAAWSYPAVKDAEGNVWFWRDTTDSAGRWLLAPARLAASFEAGEEWEADCDHDHSGRSFFDRTPWRTCDTEADCVSLRREDERTWGR